MLNLSALKKFRAALYNHFPVRRDANMNLLDALCSDGHRVRSVVELSESKHFERQYSSITDAIADGLPFVESERNKSLTTLIIYGSGTRWIFGNNVEYLVHEITHNVDKIENVCTLNIQQWDDNQRSSATQINKLMNQAIAYNTKKIQILSKLL